MGRPNHVTWWLVYALGVTGVLAGVGILGWGPAPAQGATTIEMVTVGDAGNAGELSGDGSGGYGPPRVCGAVPYVYQIGKYEVTNAQYRTFLNSVARHGDPYSLYLYNPAGPGQYQGIARSGSGAVGDPYVYAPKNTDPNWDTRPVNYVSWYSCLRFVNWVQNGQPTAEAGPGVTETGTYTFSDPSTVTLPDHASVATPHFVLPTEDEWYKIAYYKGGGTAGGYWDYATRSDTLPNNNPPNLDTGNSANYYFLDEDPNTPGYGVGPPYYMTDVGAYSLSVSAYGTYDQNGNIGELAETLLDPGNYPNIYVLRDSSWAYYQSALAAYNRAWGAGPGQRVADMGFRVALVPEPSTILMLSAGCMMSVIRKRRRS